MLSEYKIDKRHFDSLAVKQNSRSNNNQHIWNIWAVIRTQWKLQSNEVRERDHVETVNECICINNDTIRYVIYNKAHIIVYQ